MQDVEMKSTDEKKTEKKEEAPPPKPTLLQEIKANVQLIERGVASMEPRFSHRVLRTLTALRKRLNADVLRAAIEDTIEGIDASFMLEHVC
jgi:26S proteasome regulatory subunit N3